MKNQNTENTKEVNLFINEKVPMKKSRVIIEATVFALISFYIFYISLSMKIVPAVIGALIIFSAVCVREYFKYRLRKEKEEEFK